MEAESKESHSPRRAGLLLHPTSLPGPQRQGDIGHQVYRFIEFAAAAGFQVWQLLPLGPTHADGSPYQSLSVHAGNPLLISLDWLVDRGWLQAGEEPGGDVEFRLQQLRSAYHGYIAGADKRWRQRYSDFCHKHAHWLDDFALFVALRNEQGGKPWWEWPQALRDRQAAALKEAQGRLADELEQVRFEQFLFFTQWLEVKAYAHQHGLQLFGDLPIFVAHDSAEVWAHREQFDVDKKGGALQVAGVPPDYFSETGQLWGNPLYDWGVMERDGFQWWVSRIRTQLELFDIVRIDHFRGLQAYWSIPAEAETAMEGKWVEAPGSALLKKLHQSFDELPLVAEDLGLITEEVHELRKKFAIPGMLVLQFAFDGDPDNSYLPHNHEKDMVVYTATHDNDTTVGWYRDLDDQARAYVDDYLGNSEEPQPWPMIRAALASVAELAVVPMQDILELDGGHRMNTPGTEEDNWSWRYDWSQVPPDLAERLHHLIKLYGRV